MTIIEKFYVVTFSLGSAIYSVENGTHSDKKRRYVCHSPSKVRVVTWRLL